MDCGFPEFTFIVINLILHVGKILASHSLVDRTSAISPPSTASKLTATFLKPDTWLAAMLAITFWYCSRPRNAEAFLYNDKFTPHTKHLLCHQG